MKNETLIRDIAKWADNVQRVSDAGPPIIVRKKAIPVANGRVTQYGEDPLEPHWF